MIVYVRGKEMERDREREGEAHEAPTNETGHVLEIGSKWVRGVRCEVCWLGFGLRVKGSRPFWRWR